jgi:hypothetical protein
LMAMSGQIRLIRRGSHRGMVSSFVKDLFVRHIHVSKFAGEEGEGALCLESGLREVHQAHGNGQLHPQKEQRQTGDGVEHPLVDHDLCFDFPTRQGLSVPESGKQGALEYHRDRRAHVEQDGEGDSALRWRRCVCTSGGTHF